MDIRLVDSGWSIQENVFVRGHIFYKNELFVGKDFCTLILSINKNGLKKFFEEVDGFFSIIINNQENAIIVTDHIRSYPLFVNLSRQIISDRILHDDFLHDDFNNASLQQYQYGFYTLGDTTILNNWSSIRSSTICIVSEKLSCERYWKLSYSSIRIHEKQKSFELLEETYDHAAKQLVRYLNGRTAIVPLSGGHDSRMVLHLLTKENYQKIKTYSYGIKNNDDAVVSKKIAEAYGLPWEFVEYKPKQMNKLFVKKFGKFSEFQTNASSIPQLQDWFAVETLIQRGYFPSDSVFIPGHSGDLTTGYLFKEIHNLKNDILTKEGLLEIIVKKFMPNAPLNEYEFVKNIMEEKCWSIIDINNENKISKEVAEEVFERFNMEERQTHYECNTMRTYYFYSFDFCCPLNYKILFDSWYRIANELRFNRELLIDFERYYYKNTPLESIDFAIKYGKPISQAKKRLLKVLKGPMFAHFVFGYYNFSRLHFYSLLVNHKLIDVNFFLQKSYLLSIKNYIKENK